MRRKRKGWLFVLLLGLVLVIGFFGVSTFGANSPEEVVELFYEYEKDGDFGNSWELFHSEMKKRFDKSDYIQTKNHVFFGHMAVDTFDVEIGDTDKLNRWTLGKDGPVFQNVYQVEVTLTFKSQFGLFDMVFYCYTVEEDGDWKVLWDYNY
ncbi:MAG TPA: hypothetical protein VNM69_11925 [Bacillus sp. (in: firmicutes)]|uniref:hypothetical protein n=1 Tax=Bacillus litorisediminis TaxID=2922713 RepID=UPI001FABB084|nr:hypothetical protein [Bacillus litorisediminis]HWO76586.1 hypothetical protein [Bacillus sp. (in: firmicutes)]